MKPFNLEEALSGKPVVNRHNLPVTIIEAVEEDNGTVVYGKFNGESVTWLKNGKRFALLDMTSSLDLFMAEDCEQLKKSGWVVVRNSTIDVPAHGHSIFDTKDEAISYRNKRGSGIIAKIEYENETLWINVNPANAPNI